MTAAAEMLHQSNNLLLFLQLLTMLVWNVSGLDISILPTTGVYKANDSVIISCSTNNTAAESNDIRILSLFKVSLIVPNFAAINSNTVKEKIFGVSGESFLISDRLKSRANLTAALHSVQFFAAQSDEGKYYCIGHGLIKKYQSLNLPSLVMQQDPAQPVIHVTDSSSGSIDSVELKDLLKINCTANVGKPAGQLELRDINNKVMQTNVKQSHWVVLSKDGESALYHSLETSDSVTDKHQNAVYKCQVKPNATLINNTIPLTVSSDPIDVKIKVTDIKIDPFRERFFHEDKIQCIARGHPAPQFRWTKLNGPSDLPANDTWLLMPKVAKTGYYAYTCSAVNKIRGLSYEVQASIGFTLYNRTVPEKPSVGTKVKTWVKSHHKGISVALITVGALCGMVLLAVICAYLYNSSSSGNSTSYNRLNTDRAKLYGANGEISSDEEESYQPLNKNSSEGHWLGTQV